MGPDNDFMTESLTALAATGTARPAAADEVVEGLVREHLPLVGFAVGEVIGRVPAHVRRDDLVSAGQFALFTAAKGYDPGLGVPFAAFALRRVRGAVIDELRRTDWASRSVRRRAREAQTARDALAAQLGRVPTERETAESMGVPVAELRGLGSDVARAAVLSIQGLGTPRCSRASWGTTSTGPRVRCWPASGSATCRTP